MRELISLLLLAGLGNVLGGCPFGPPVQPTMLEGLWVGGTFVQGAPLHDDPSYGETIEFSGKRFTVTVQNPGEFPKTITGWYLLHETRGTINLRVETSPDGSSGLSLGVFSIQNDQLYLSFGGIGGERPSASLLDPGVGPVFVGQKQAGTKSMPDPGSAGGLLR